MENSGKWELARAIFAAKSAAGIDIEMHSSVERFCLLPEDVSLYLVFDGSEAVLRRSVPIRVPAVRKAAFHTGQYAKEVAAAPEAACVQRRREERRPPDNLRKLHFLK